MKWSKQEERLLRSFINKGYSYDRIAKLFAKRVEEGVPGFRVYRSSEAIRYKCRRENLTYRKKVAVDEARVKEHWKVLKQIENKYKQEFNYTSSNVNATKKILALSDIHFPFTDVSRLQDIVAEHSDAHIVVLNGDIIDGAIFSTFADSKHIAAIDEYRMAFEFVRTLSENFPDVVLVSGNHDNRISRALKRLGLNSQATDILRPDVLQRIANGEVLDVSGALVKKIDMPNVHYSEIDSWYTKIGKTIFVHPSSTNSNPGGTVMRWGDILRKRYPVDEVDSIVCGHTHKIFKGIYNGVLYIEQGYLGSMLSYAFKPTYMAKYNYQIGYAVIYQDSEGNTDFNKSTPIYLGEISPKTGDIDL